MKLTCHSARDKEGELCGYPALFKYTPVTWTLPPIILCSDCAYAILHDHGWQIKDGKARLEPLDMVRFRAYCPECIIHVTMSWTPGAPSGNPGQFTFCPRCGKKVGYFIDADKDYWEILTESLGTPEIPYPLELAQMLYQEWDRTKYSRFFDFVRAFEEADGVIAEEEEVA